MSLNCPKKVHPGVKVVYTSMSESAWVKSEVTGGVSYTRNKRGVGVGGEDECIK